MTSLARFTRAAGLVALTACLALPLLVLAQDVAVDPLSLVPLLVAAVKGHQYPVAVGLALTGLTFVLRKVVGPRWAWIKTDRGGATFALLVALLGTLGAELAAGVHGWMTILDALAAALSSAGGYALVKKLLAPSDVKPAAPAPASSGGTLSAVALLLAFGLGAPGLARAQDPQPVPVLGVCLDKANVVCLRPIASFGGAAYDFSQHQIVRSVSVSGLYELTLRQDKTGRPALGVAVGGGFQTGTVQGVTLTELVTLPYTLAVGASELIVGSKASITLLAGTVVRF